MAIAIADKPKISGLSRSNIEVTTAGLKRFLKKSMWIGKTNRYADDVVQSIQTYPPTTAERQRNLAQYIAASAALHANDGWSYLGRSIACLLAGDAHRALHFGYYAELRAGVSLLASAGIGVFKNAHFIISAVNSTAQLSSKAGTHQIAWDALEFWSDQPPSGALFAKLIQPDGRTLDDWFQGLGGSTALAAQARHWFMQWGMDLGFAAKDRNARNGSSYRPDGIPSPLTLSAATVLDFVSDLWLALEPGMPSSFEHIDQYILRLALENHFYSITATKPSSQNPNFITLVNNVTAAQGFSNATEQRWRDFLLRTRSPTDPRIFVDSALKPGDPATDHFSIISRAVLLLRLATGSAHDLLQQAGFDASALSFWWEAIGESRGLWEPGFPPAALGDLWADVRDSLSDFDHIAAGDPAVLNSMSGLASGIGERLRVFCSHERVGLWALCPV